eukprot:1714766-Amphidinium_carterae.1
MRGQKKQKPETDIVREGAIHQLKKATPPTGINPVPLPPPPKAKSSDIVLPNISEGMSLPPPPAKVKASHTQQTPPQPTGAKAKKDDEADEAASGSSSSKKMPVK